MKLLTTSIREQLLRNGYIQAARAEGRIASSGPHETIAIDPARLSADVV